MKKASNKSSSKFTDNLCFHYDRETLLQSNNMFKMLYENRVVDNWREFNNWMRDVKNCNLNLVGNENALQINKIMMDKL